MKIIFCNFFIFLVSCELHGQLRIEGGGFIINGGTTVSTSLDVNCNINITGSGTLELNGSAPQNLNMNGKTIPNLNVNNASNVNLQSTDTRIGTNLQLLNGKLVTGNLNLVLAPTASITGNNSTRFISTSGTGQLIKELTGPISNFELPVGENSNYRPATLTITGGLYSSAKFGVRNLGTAPTNTPPMMATNLKTHWISTKQGITGTPTITLEGQYIDPLDIIGTEANLVGYYYNNIEWRSIGETHNVATNKISAPVTSDTGTLTGLNHYLSVGARALLQGAYNTGTGLMTANLRTLPFGPSSSTANFPRTDPYRVAPYSSTFTHVNNANIDSIPNASVLATQTPDSNSIVDWVFLELRNLDASPGNDILQTRSALIQRDGDVVDVDGVSPVTFNHLADGNYILAIRHRNHLGLSIDQSAPKALEERKTKAYNVNLINFTTASDASLYGPATAYTTAANPDTANPVVNLLWGGNANSNSNTRYTGLSNDKDYLLITTLGNVLSNTLNNIYHGADVNMNKVVRYTGLSNDKDFILITVLGNVLSTTRTQAMPN